MVARALAFAVLLVLATGTVAHAAAALVMFEAPGCPYCEAWHREIGPGYPKSEEGQRFPLRVVNLRGERPEDLRHIKGVTFTPTFILVQDGREVGRISGYPGDDFFWGLLAELIAKAKP